ncbi:Valine--tRNA ligase, mitochondrial [Labeo rohita]|uniref:Valine--tRNA ligase, mitochondrial n=1 Tax=Labeo rohita TaxID=84645 RepID=A0ABQ8LRZ1_LABRO|nr:Valine--tRNA ligase, mitochondrial [Labeo rohita]
MWMAVHVASPRIWSRDLQKAWSRWGCRLCSQSSSNTQPSHHPRTQAEKAKRRQAREKAVLSSDVNDPGLSWSDKEKITYTAPLVPGEKKDTTLPIPQSYSPEYSKQPHAVDKYFSLCIPPPNVTGTLHLGHALTVAIEDALARWRRMQGYKVLWVPGCDHAGIATQSVVERKLMREQGKCRRDYSREEFLKQGFSSAVTEAFVRLCDSGLIYRSEGLVNWSCALESAISDIEVDSKELSGRTLLSVPGYQQKVEFGVMVTFAYPLEGQEGEVTVSTTRPETMLGDVAIVVHPDDPRYKDIHGKHCRHPFTERLLPIVTDSMRHSLPRLTVIGGDGTMTSDCGQWLEGVKRFDARERVITALMERKLFRGKQDHPMSLPICSRSGDVIEPLLKKQWFVRCQEMSRKAVEWKREIYRLFLTFTQKCGRAGCPTSGAVGLGQKCCRGSTTRRCETEDLKQFYPNSILETGSDLIFFWVARMVMLGRELTGQLPFKQVLFHSLVRDKYGRKMSKSLGNVIDPLDVISGVSLERLQEKVKEGNLDPRESFVAMEAQKKDFPKGIPECGTDALRFALCSYKAQGEDISLSVSHVLNCRHFCNKMWQTMRFTLATLHDASVPTSLAEQCERGFESYELHTVTSALHSFWLHSLCDVYLESIKPVLKGEGSESEEQRVRERQVAVSVLYHSVSISLALLSPFMPFLTEELWQRLLPYADSDGTSSSLCVQPYPKTSQLKHWCFPKEEADFSLVQEVVRVARLLRAQCQLTKERPDLWAVCAPHQAETLLHFRSAICTLGRISALHLHCPEGGFTDSPPPPKASAVGVVDHSICLHLSIQNGVNADKQRALLSQRREKLASKLKQALARTQTPSYAEKVPDKIAAMEQELKNIEDQLLALEDTRKETF